MIEILNYIGYLGLFCLIAFPIFLIYFFVESIINNSRKYSNPNTKYIIISSFLLLLIGICLIQWESFFKGKLGDITEINTSFANVKFAETQSTKIYKELSDLASQASILEASITHYYEMASSSYNKLDSITEFLVTQITAQNDDLPSLLKLKEWGEDKNYPYSTRAKKAWLDITEEVNKFYVIGGFTYKWPEGIDPNTFTIVDFRRYYDEEDSPPKKIDIMGSLFYNKNISIKDKIEFYIESAVIEKNSIQVAQYTGRYIDLIIMGNKDILGENISYNVFREPTYKEWWEKIKETVPLNLLQNTNLKIEGSMLKTSK